jgi:hypothetical protein
LVGRSCVGPLKVREQFFPSCACSGVPSAAERRFRGGYLLPIGMSYHLTLFKLLYYFSAKYALSNYLTNLKEFLLCYINSFKIYGEYKLHMASSVTCDKGPLFVHSSLIPVFCLQLVVIYLTQLCIIALALVVIFSVNSLKPKLVYMLFKNPVRTSKRTPHFTVTKINWLMLFKEMIAVYS